MKVTLKDIAKIVGVSPSTVSRSLNDHPSIPNLTREKIKLIAKEMGFTFNQNARSLVKKSTNTLAILFPEGYCNYKTRESFISLEKSLIQNLEKEGFYVFTTSIKNFFTKNSNLLELVNGSKIDGLFILTEDLSQEEISTLLKSKIPYVFVNFSPNNDLENSPYNIVINDDIYGGYQCTKFLYDKGCKNIITITSNEDNILAYKQRTQGYNLFMDENNLKKSYIYSLIDFESGYEYGLNNFKNILKYDGIFSQQDLFSLGLVKALIEKDKDIFNKIKLISYDGFSISSMFSPELTTFVQPFNEIGNIASKLLIDQINKNIDSNKIVKVRGNISEKETTI